MLTKPCNIEHSQLQHPLLHAQERQAGEDQAQEAASELLKDMAEDDTRQEPWQPKRQPAEPYLLPRLCAGLFWVRQDMACARRGADMSLSCLSAIT